MVVVVRFGLETVPEKTTANEIWYLENFSDFKTGGCVTLGYGKRRIVLRNRVNGSYNLHECVHNIYAHWFSLPL